MEMKNGPRVNPATNISISPSESQERIIGSGKTEAHITTSRGRSGSGSDELIPQGITVTTDVKVVRD